METRGVTPKLWVDAPDLAELVSQPGPFLTLVMATEAEVENAAQRNELRWKSVREGLLGHGADERALAVVDPLVPDAHLAGQTLVVVANAGGARHVAHWPELPFREVAQWAPLPSLAPVIGRRQEAPPYVVVLTDRRGADIVAVRQGASELSMEAGEADDVLRKVNAGGWSQRRYQERAENSWDQNAREVADRVARVAERVDARVVVVAGDVRAVQLLREQLPDRVAELVQEVGGGRGAGAQGADSEEVERLVAQVVAEDERALLGKLAEELGQHDRGRSGVAGTVAALTAAQVEVLLVHDDPDDDRTGFFAPGDPALVAHRREALEGLTPEIREGRLVDALVRTALGSGAGVRVLPSADGVDEGIGAILRWA